MNQIICPCNCGTVIHALVCSECLAAADPTALKQVVHMTIPKHKELCDKLATLQNQVLQLGMKNDAMAVAVKAVWLAWTQGGDFNHAKRLVKKAYEIAVAPKGTE
jgi:hypothetical protein